MSFTVHEGAKVDVAIELEQEILGRMIYRPAEAEVALRRLTPEDFAEPLHAQMFEHLVALHAAGREPSVAALKAVVGEDEIAPGVSGGEYLKRLYVHGAGVGDVADAVETLLDLSRKAAIERIGSNAMFAARSTRAAHEIVRETIEQLQAIPGAIGKTYRRKSSASAIDGLFEFLTSEGTHCIPTGLLALDTAVGGWPRGELSVVAGRPGMGKSALGVHAARVAAEAGLNVLVGSLEMTEEQIMARLICDVAFDDGNPLPVFYSSIMRRKIAPGSTFWPRVEKAAAKVRRLPIHIIASRSMSAESICENARQYAAELAREGKTLDLVIVDHIGLVTPSSRYAGTRHREVAEITNALATLAKDLTVAVIALSQLNRQVLQDGEKRPSLGHLKDSGSIEEDASLVILAHRPAYYLEGGAATQKAHDLELIVAKNRNGPTSSIEVYCHIGANAIRNAAP